ncbi:MAG: DUF1289 domain-containing protein [Sedimenticola sp.]|nr:DUF1289 domain-containing protein [Sedimenticola sp.]
MRPGADGPEIEAWQLEKAIRSPCVRICTLDDKDICIGCGRSLEEIKRWNGYSAMEQHLRLINCARRRKGRLRNRYRI